MGIKVAGMERVPQHPDRDQDQEDVKGGSQIGVAMIVMLKGSRQWQNKETRDRRNSRKRSGKRDRVKGTTVFELRIGENHMGRVKRFEKRNQQKSQSRPRGHLKKRPHLLSQSVISFHHLL